jgi:hypothetical protein
VHDDEALAATQEALLDALEAGRSPDEVRRAVAATGPEAAAWAEGWRDRPLRVAVGLLRRWVRR